MMTVLVAEEDAVVRGLLHTILGQAGYGVAEAASAAGAWRVLNERGLEALIVGVGPMALDGLELVRRIRAVDELRDLPVVAVTSDAALVNSAFEAGADSVVTKPFKVTALLDALVDAIEGHGLTEASA